MTQQNEGPSPSQAPTFPPIIENANRRQFKMGEYLGKGGFAWCYMVTDLLTGELYAVKVISKKWLTKQHHHDKVNREIRIHNNVEHEHIVKLYSAFSDQYNIYILLEYCKYKSIVNVMRSKPVLDERETRHYVYELLLALLHLHEQKHVLHRDVKLGNMLVDHKNSIKLCDFGLATDRQNPPPALPDVHSDTISICGTPNYIAPEILRKEGHSVASESWAVGCVMYAMLHGRPPFETQNLDDTYARIRLGQYSLLDSISPAAADLITRLLRADPSSRLTPRQMLGHQFIKDEKVARSLGVAMNCAQQQPLQHRSAQAQDVVYMGTRRLAAMARESIDYCRSHKTSCALSSGSAHKRISPPPIQPNVVQRNAHVRAAVSVTNLAKQSVPATQPINTPSTINTQLGCRSCTSRGSADSGLGSEVIVLTDSPPRPLTSVPLNEGSRKPHQPPFDCTQSPRLSAVHANTLLWMRNLILHEIQSPLGYQVHTNGNGNAHTQAHPWLMQLPTTQSRVPMCRVLCVTKWIDYTNRLGFGAQLSDGSVWTWHKDGATLLASELPGQAGYDLYEFVSADGSVSRSFVASQDQLGTLDADMRSRLSTLNLFKRYMDNNLMGAAGHKGQSAWPARPGAPSLVTWLRTDVDVLMVFSDGAVQINNSASHMKVHLCALNQHQLQMTFLDSATCLPSAQYVMGIQRESGQSTCATCDLLPLMQSLSGTLLSAAHALSAPSTAAPAAPVPVPSYVPMSVESVQPGRVLGGSRGASQGHPQCATIPLSALPRSSSCAQLQQVCRDPRVLARNARCKVTNC